MARFDTFISYGSGDDAIQSEHGSISVVAELKRALESHYHHDAFRWRRRFVACSDAEALSRNDTVEMRGLTR